MTSFDLNIAADHFTLLHMPQVQALDLPLLDANFRELQARVHPDKHAQGSATDQRLAMQWATRINEAYQCLRAPVLRARYLLELRGHDVQVESNTAMPPEFLMAQMELREEVEAARIDADGTALDALATRIRTEIRSETRQLANLIDDQHDYAAARQLVRQLMFQEKLLYEIDDALGDLDVALS